MPPLFLAHGQPGKQFLERSQSRQRRSASSTVKSASAVSGCRRFDECRAEQTPPRAGSRLQRACDLTCPFDQGQPPLCAFAPFFQFERFFELRILRAGQLDLACAAPFRGLGRP
jgi:hypothetical protein